MFSRLIVNEDLDPITLARKVVILEERAEFRHDAVRQAAVVVALLALLGACLI